MKTRFQAPALTYAVAATLTMAAALSLAPAAARAADSKDKSHDPAHAHTPLHGGVVVEVKDIDYELVATPTAIRLHLRDHGKPVDLVQATARLTLLTAGQKQDIDLKPAGDKLEATGTFKLAPGSKAVAVVTRSGRAASTVRFVLP